MTAPKLVGTIAEKDGSICVQTAANCWFPLGGNSAIAEKFRESFNDPAAHDIGRRLFMFGDVLQMENMEQMRERVAHDPDTNPDWTAKLGFRVYACAECGTEKTVQTNHTGTVPAEPCAGTCRDIFNPHTAREVVQWHPARPHRYIREARS
jgi:hypothetical protein